MASDKKIGTVVGVIVAVAAVFLVVMLLAGTPSFCEPPPSNPAPTN